MKITFDSGNIGKKEVKKLIGGVILLVIILVEALFVIGQVIGTYMADYLTIVGKATFTCCMGYYIYKICKDSKKDTDKQGILKDVALYGFLASVISFLSSFLAGWVDGAVISALEGIMGFETTAGRVLITLVFVGILIAIIVADLRASKKKQNDDEEEEEK